MDNKKIIIIAASALLVIMLLFLLVKQPQDDTTGQLQIVTTESGNQLQVVTTESEEQLQETTTESEEQLQETATEGEEQLQEAVTESGEQQEATTESETQVQETAVEVIDDQNDSSQTEYRFRSSKLLNNHYEKHGKEMGFNSPEEYEQAAAAVVNNPNALHKTEKEDGDDVYYVEKTNEFVVVSTDGYIRTYFNPSDGINYYKRQ